MGAAKAAPANANPATGNVEDAIRVLEPRDFHITGHMDITLPGHARHPTLSISFHRIPPHAPAGTFVRAHFE